MGLRDRMYELTSPEEVEEFFSEFPTCAIFKAGSCHKTMEGFAQVEQVLDPYEPIRVGFIRVIESRSASNFVADLTGIVHQSPQIILFVDGKACFDLDNWDITVDALQPAAQDAFGEATGEAASPALGDLSQYVKLLHGFIIGEVPEADFRERWLTTFQEDASLRSQEEFDLLNGLFGDVDKALFDAALDDTLQDRAGTLLENLLSLAEPVS